MAVREERASSGASRSVASSIKPVAKIVKSSAPVRKAAKVVRRSSSSGSSSRSSSSRSSGSSSRSSSSSRRSSPTPKPAARSAPRPTPRPAPVIQPPSINSYLGTDSIYQDALSGGKRSLADFLSEIGRRRGEAGTQYQQTLGNMNRDRDQQLADLRDEFASRGLINSGLYGQEQGRFQQQFTDQINALGQQQTGLLADLLSQENNAKRENDLAMQAAKQEALARRAAKYKIGA